MVAVVAACGGVAASRAETESNFVAMHDEGSGGLELSMIEKNWTTVTNSLAK